MFNSSLSCYLPGMALLSVNVNKLATLRNSRGQNQPDVTSMSAKILRYGAAGITVHPRPDARHIRTQDVRELNQLVKEWTHPAEFNVEGYPAPDFMELIEQTRPHQATLVPDPPDAITSNAGWNLEASETLLEGILARLARLHVRASLFVDPNNFSRYQQDALVRLKPARIELYTERFAKTYGGPEQAKVLEAYVLTAKFAREHGIGVNAGHDLNQNNLGALLDAIPWIDEVSIGHALICESLEDGLEKTVRSYLKILESHGHDPRSPRPPG